MKPFLLSTLFLFLSSLLFLGFLWTSMFLPPLQERMPVEVRVERGEPFSSIVRKLEDGDVIHNSRLFSLWARFWGLDKRIHWGLYLFELPLAPREVLHQMVLGRGVFHRITIPEGLTVREIGELLEKAGVASKDRFLAETKSPEVLSQLGLRDKGAEGYLFPDTYYFTPFATERDMALAMARQFREIFLPLIEEKRRELGLSLHEIVTIASLIEKETGMASERPLVSAVFHNRLQRRIPLQSDPTVIYGLRRFSGTLTRRDLQSRSPYNTYRIQGLPPTPICNPGLASLLAALNPAPAPYLYFVAKNDGSHLFSVSLEEHNRAVRLYQGGGQRPSKP